MIYWCVDCVHYNEAKGCEHVAYYVACKGCKEPRPRSVITPGHDNKKPGFWERREEEGER